MKKTTSILITAAVSFAVSGIISAAGFENDVKAVSEKLMVNAGGEQIEIADPIPVPSEELITSGPKWWSVTFFGSAHRHAAKSALKAMNKALFPDIAAAKDILIDQSNDEGGHRSGELNGGPVKEIWFGNTPFSRGGVLGNYTQFKFNEAYSRLGTICHLTQDQAVPVHAANIKHGISDSFEGYYGNDVNITTRRSDVDREPWEYYQVLQDETRSKLPGWTDPKTGLPYWVAAPDAPRFGEDITNGPWGHYGGRKNRDVWAVPPPQNNNDSGNNNNIWITEHAEIRQDQLNISGEVTISVLESASKRLPPLVQNLSVSTTTLRFSDGVKAGYSVKFNVYENRAPGILYTMYVYRDGQLLGEAFQGAASLFPPKKDEGMMFSGALTAAWAGVVNFEPLPPGTYTLDLRVTDEDDNVTPDMVNDDAIPENDTKKTIVIE
ncbi:MAG: hypothetical protein WCK76_13115 [Elusimicrobiota bacterium]